MKDRKCAVNEHQNLCFFCNVWSNFKPRQLLHMHRTAKSLFSSGLNAARIRVGIGLRCPLLVVKGDLNGWGGGSFGRDHENRSLVSQKVWHDKDPSLVKVAGAEYTCRTRSCGPSPMLPFQRNLFELDVQHETPYVLVIKNSLFFTFR